MAVEVVDLLEAVQVHHDKVAEERPGGVQLLQRPPAHLQEGPAVHGACQGVVFRLVLHIGGVPAVEDQKEDDQGHQSDDPDQKLDLQMDQVGVPVIRKGDALLPQHRLHPMDEVESHGKGGAERHQYDGHQGEAVVPLPQLQVPGHLHPELELLPDPGPEEAPHEDDDDRDDQVGEPRPYITGGPEGVGGAVARLREKGPHGRIHQEGVDGPPQE